MTRLSVEILRARELNSDGAPFLEKYLSHVPCLSLDGNIWHYPSVGPVSESVATFCKNRAKTLSRHRDSLMKLTETFFLS